MNIKGDLTFSTVMQWFEQGRQAIRASQANTVIFNFAEVTHSDSSSIALLIEWMRYARLLNKQIAFENMPQKMKQVVALAQINV